MKTHAGLMLLTLLLASYWLTGCSAFSGASTMRIDVEVYKGPLSERPNVQLGIMKGHLESTRKALIEENNFTRAVMANKGFQSWDGREGNDPKNKTTSNTEKKNRKAWPIPRINTDNSGNIIDTTVDPPKPSDLGSEKLDSICSDIDPDVAWYEFKFWRLFGLLDDMDHFDCLILRTLIADTNMLIEKVDRLIGRVNKHTRTPASPLPDGFIEEAAEISGMLRDQAFRWAVASTPGQSPNRLVRIAVVTGIVTFSEIGNQLKCRVNALAKQTNDAIGLDRRELPPSVALCDADPTNFVNLYNHLNGTLPDWMASQVLGMGTVEDRVKLVKDLFSDHYWSRINTVYASGRGKTSMAFIKDDVGNWNLKSFDNNPEELLNAYTDFSIEAAKRAAMAIQSASPGGPIAPALTLATRLMEQSTANAFGHETVRSESTIVPRLHRTTEARLRIVAKEYQEKDQELLDNYETESKRVENSSESRSGVTNTTAVDQARNKLIEHRKAMLTKMETIIQDHKKTVSGHADVD